MRWRRRSSRTSHFAAVGEHRLRSPSLRRSRPLPGGQHRARRPRTFRMVARTEPAELRAVGPDDRARAAYRRRERRHRAHAAAVRGGRARAERRSAASWTAPSELDPLDSSAVERSGTCRWTDAGRWRTAPNPPSRSSCRTSGRTSRAGGTTRVRRRTRRPLISAPFRGRVVARLRGLRGPPGRSGRARPGRPLLPGGAPRSGRRGGPGSGESDRLRPGLGSALPRRDHGRPAQRRERDRDHRLQHCGERSRR